MHSSPATCVHPANRGRSDGLGLAPLTAIPTRASNKFIAEAVANILFRYAATSLSLLVVDRSHVELKTMTTTNDFEFTQVLQEVIF
jgi:hypothetical protein